MSLKVPTTEKWRQANKPVKTIFGLNPSLITIYLFGIFAAKYIPMLTLIIAVVLTVFFSVIEHRGISAGMAFRWVRSWLGRYQKILLPKWVRT